MSNTTPISAEQFKNKFDVLVNSIWSAQDRIAEIEEFERQWDQIFEVLKKQTATEDVRITIHNHYAYRTFFWDRYQILIVDLLSILADQTSNEFSVLKQSKYHAEIKSNEWFVNQSFTKTVEFHNSSYTQPATPDESERLRVVIAKQMRDGAIEAFNRLFGQYEDTTLPTNDQVALLIKKIETIKAKIYSQRQAFAHKHEERAYSKHKHSLETLTISHLKEVSSEFFDIIRDIGLIHHRSNYANHDYATDVYISDQIDLILFGTIENALQTFKQDNTSGSQYYTELRRQFFSSDKVKALIAD